MISPNSTSSTPPPLKTHRRISNQPAENSFLHAPIALANNMRNSNFIGEIKWLLSKTLRLLPYMRQKESSQKEFAHEEPQQPQYEKRISGAFRAGPYIVSKKIGSGSFGGVHICRHGKTNKRYAGKYFTSYFAQEEKNVEMVLSEVSILKKLSHENTISFVDLIFIKEGILIVMELVEGKNLGRVLPKKGGMFEAFARVVFVQVLNAIQHLHGLSIVHRDIKIENVMIDKRGKVKLVDYGLAESAIKSREGLMVTGYCGTRTHYSPELATCEEDDEKDREFAGDKIDIWAAGIFLYSLVAGRGPYQYSNSYELLLEIRLNNIEWNVDFSPELADLLRKILRPNPDERLSIDEILRHPWTRGSQLTQPSKGLVFRSSYGKVEVELDRKTPENATSCPKTFLHQGLGEQPAKRSMTMPALIDWRIELESIPENVDTESSGTSDWAESKHQSNSPGIFDCREEEWTRSRSKLHFPPDVKRVLGLVCSLFKRRPRRTPLECKLDWSVDMVQEW